MSPSPGNDNEQIIARLSAWRALRCVLPSLVEMFIFGGLACLFLHSTSQDHAIRAINIFVLAMIPVGVCVQLLALSSLRTVSVRNGWLVVGRSAPAVQSAPLSNVKEIRICGWGSPRLLGTDRGTVGVVLRQPELRIGNDRMSHLLPRMSTLLRGVHIRIFPMYQEAPEALAQRIAGAAVAAGGIHVPILIATKNAELLAIARPVAEPVLVGEHVQNPARSPLPDRIECIRCGYDLRAHARASHCPECGMPVARSMRGRFLSNADQRWVMGLRRASFVIGASVTLAVGAAVAMLLDRIRCNVGTGAPPPSALQSCCLLVALAGFFVGSAWFARPSDDGVGLAGESRARRYLLVVLCLPLVCSLAALAHLTSKPTLLVASVGSFSLVAAALAWYARRIFERIPNQAGSIFSAIVAAIHLVLALIVVFVARVLVFPPVSGASAKPGPPPQLPNSTMWIPASVGMGAALLLALLFVVLGLCLYGVHQSPATQRDEATS